MKTLKLNRIFLFTLLVVALATSACNLVITPPPPATPPPAVELNPNGAIFTAEQSTASLDAVRVLNGDIEDTWTPTDEDIAKLEENLPAFLETADNQWLKPDPPIWEREPDYMRQYLGL